MILMHEQHLREFVSTWREAKAAGFSLPETTDRDYQSMETLLVHLLACARGYMVWMCRVLELPDPGIDTAPTPETVDADAARSLGAIHRQVADHLGAVTVHQGLFFVKRRIEAARRHVAGPRRYGLPAVEALNGQEQ